MPPRNTAQTPGSPPHARPPRDPETITARRRRAAARHGTVLEAQYCPQTGAGAVLFESVAARGVLTRAMLFRPGAVTTPFAIEDIASAHARLGVLDLLHSRLAEEKAAKTRPHDLEVGDIVADVWGATMRYADFYRVVGVPHPRKVRLARLPHTLVSGDIMAGAVAPLEDAAPGAAATFWVDMSDGAARVKMGSSIHCARRWHGRPIGIHSD